MAEWSGVKISGQGPAVVFLHSSLSSSSQWQALVNDLSVDRRCINIDLLGYGTAPPVTDSDSFQLMTEVERVMAIVTDTIGDSPFAVVGHSFGAAVGLRLVHEYSARIRAMAIYEPVAFHLLDRPSAAYLEVAKVANALPQLAALASAKTFVDYWNGDGYFDTLPERTKTLFSQQMAKVSLDFQAISQDPCQISDYQRSHQNHCIPTLIMEGQHSRLSAKAVSRLLAETLPGAVHFMFDGGHMAPVAQSQRVSEIIGHFLRSY